TVEHVNGDRKVVDLVRRPGGVRVNVCVHFDRGRAVVVLGSRIGGEVRPTREPVSVHERAAARISGHRRGGSVGGATLLDAEGGISRNHAAFATGGVLAASAVLTAGAILATGARLAAGAV